MKNTAKRQENNLVKGMLIGIGMAAICAILGAMLLTTFIISGLTDLNNMDVYICITLFASVLVGGLCIKRTAGQGRGGITVLYPICAIVLLSLINVTLLGGDFNRVMIKAAAVVAGSTVVLMKGNGKRKKYGRTKNR